MKKHRERERWTPFFPDTTRFSKMRICLSPSPSFPSRRLFLLLICIFCWSTSCPVKSSLFLVEQQMKLKETREKEKVRLFLEKTRIFFLVSLLDFVWPVVVVKKFSLEEQGWDCRRTRKKNEGRMNVYGDCVEGNAAQDGNKMHTHKWDRGWDGREMIGMLFVLCPQACSLSLSFLGRQRPQEAGRGKDRMKETVFPLFFLLLLSL